MLRSLFARILTWLLATILITGSGVALIGVFSNAFNQRPSPSMFLIEAEYRYKVGGAEGLSEYIQRIHGNTGPEAFMTDASGRDLASGADRSDVLRQAVHGWLPFAMRGFRFFFYEHDPEGHWFFIEAPPIWGRQWINRIWILGVIVAFCYVLARHLTRPLRSLQIAVERFGKGDFMARVASRRQDEVGELSKTFDQMAERIQSLLASQRTLLRDISHELRSPLSRLSVAVELARSQPNNLKALDRIEKEAGRLNVLVQEVLSLAQSENPQFTHQRSPIDLNAIVQHLLDLSAIEAGPRNCRLVLHSSGAVIVNGDEELLRRALENVLRNAVRYAPANTEVTITLKLAAAGVHIQVRDLGPGVPPESLTRIFEPFYRVDKARNRETGGTGLGLAIAKRAIENHGGHIHGRNLNPGFEVEIFLPANA